MGQQEAKKASEADRQHIRQRSIHVAAGGFGYEDGFEAQTIARSPYDSVNATAQWGQVERNFCAKMHELSLTFDLDGAVKS